MIKKFRHIGESIRNRNRNNYNYNYGKQYDYGNYGSSGGITKKWNSKDRCWDYEIDDWVAPEPKIVTKNMLEDENHDEWFKDEYLMNFDEIKEIKNKLKKEYEDYKEKNELKIKINLKKYSNIILIREIFFYFFKEYPSKNILYCNEKLRKIYLEKPSIERLKYRKKIEIPDKLKELSGNSFGIINFWIFKDVIIFKN